METQESTDPTEAEIQQEPMLQLFRHAHLNNPALRETSSHFCQLARDIVANVPRNLERSESLRFLRQAKDTACTAMIWKDVP